MRRLAAAAGAVNRRASWQARVTVTVPCAGACGYLNIPEPGKKNAENGCMESQELSKNTQMGYFD